MTKKPIWARRKERKKERKEENQMRLEEGEKGRRKKGGKIEKRKEKMETKYG